MNLTSKDRGVWTDGEKKAFSVDGLSAKLREEVLQCNRIVLFST